MLLRLVNVTRSDRLIRASCRGAFILIIIDSRDQGSTTHSLLLLLILKSLGCVFTPNSPIVVVVARISGA